VADALSLSKVADLVEVGITGPTASAIAGFSGNLELEFNPDEIKARKENKKESLTVIPFPPSTFPPSRSPEHFSTCGSWYPCMAF
jgi:hypothetical protein